MIQIDPAKIQKIPVRGSGDAATPIMWHTKWLFISLRLQFRRASGTGTETANLTLALDDQTYTENNWNPITIPGVGINSPVHFRPPYDELQAWVFWPEQRLKIAWTNPDPVEIVWGGEALVYPL